MKLPQVSEILKQRVREAAGDRCGYCLSPQRFIMGTLEVEHLVPRAQGGGNEEDNLWLSCSLCNRYKGAQTSAIDPLTGSAAQLFNPRHDSWNEHFLWSTDGVRIEGITPPGRATVEALKLNNELAVEVRRNWVRAGWHPPVIES
jgi:5-methylcytosine-specific restriction endonuclease McrA